MLCLVCSHRKPAEGLRGCTKSNSADRIGHGNSICITVSVQLGPIKPILSALDVGLLLDQLMGLDPAFFAPIGVKSQNSFRPVASCTFPVALQHPDGCRKIQASHFSDKAHHRDLMASDLTLTTYKQCTMYQAWGWLC